MIIYNLIYDNKVPRLPDRITCGGVEPGQQGAVPHIQDSRGARHCALRPSMGYADGGQVVSITLSQFQSPTVFSRVPITAFIRVAKNISLRGNLDSLANISPEIA